MSFFIQIKVASKQLATELFFIVVDNFQYFRETSNLLLPSSLPANRCYSPSNTTWFGHFLAKKRRHQTRLYSGFSRKIEYLKSYQLSEIRSPSYQIVSDNFNGSKRQHRIDGRNELPEIFLNRARPFVTRILREEMDRQLSCSNSSHYFICYLRER